MSKTCPSCGYSPIGPYSDNCPICAEPVRNVHSDGAGVLGSTNFPPVLVVGWIAIGAALAYVFLPDWPWLLLSLGLCGAAWWAVTRAETLLLRLVGGSLLVLFVPGIWLASQPDILPGLDRREHSPERFMREMMALVQGGGPESLRLSARMKTISALIFALHAIVAIPLALVGPPLLHYRQRRKLGGPIILSQQQALVGLVAWLVLLPALGYLALPTMRTWAEPPKNLPQHNWPFGAFPGNFPPGNLPQPQFPPDLDPDARD